MDTAVVAEPEGDEFASSCGCCGRPIHHGHGWLTSGRHSLAVYWYQWAEGHEGGFYLALARFDSEDYLIPGVATFGGSVEGGEIRYSALNPDEAPWEPALVEPFGPMLTRDLVLAAKDNFLNLVDAITANDQRLSSRILTCGVRG